MIIPAMAVVAADGVIVVITYMQVRPGIGVGHGCLSPCYSAHY